MYHGVWQHTDVAVKRFLEQDLCPKMTAVRLSAPAMLHALCSEWCPAPTLHHFRCLSGEPAAAELTLLLLSLRPSLAQPSPAQPSPAQP